MLKEIFTNLIDFLSYISNWLLTFSDTSWAFIVLPITVMVESIFSPIPPDPLIIVMSITNPELSFLFSLIATLFSVIGGIIGYWLGNKFGRNWTMKFVSQEKFSKAEIFFSKYGVWAIAIAAISPLPYKVFTISAGILNYNFKNFILVSLIARGVRFFILGGLLFIFGEKISTFLHNQSEIFLLAGLSLLIFCLLIPWIYFVNPFSRQRKS
ncbi:MAG: hypothetical protein CL786_04635 [Chloroflexi bacterium]|nr:hypothetical protein [Chloroflexota bacterium]|tara:strand:+ start:380 stop:1012 length:633 start_codon:yes stop_codon:yes gene_type:complete